MSDKQSSPKVSREDHDAFLKDLKDKGVTNLDELVDKILSCPEVKRKAGDPLSTFCSERTFCIYT